MLILLAAATVAAAPAPPPRSERTPNIYLKTVPARCHDARRNIVDRYGRPITRRLGDLPEAGPILLVDRRINGCPVITMMRGGPPPVVDNPNPPPSAYQVMPIRPDKH